MAIQSTGEFEVTLSGILLKLDQMLNDAPRNAPLTLARRNLGLIYGSIRKRSPSSRSRCKCWRTPPNAAQGRRRSDITDSLSICAIISSRTRRPPEGAACLDDERGQPATTISGSLRTSN